MVAYIEKTDGNAEFHEIIDFLTRNSIHYALTISSVVSTMFVEQFWMTAKSKTINNVRYITAIVVGKPVSIAEASIRNAKKKFVMYPRFIPVFLTNQLKNVPVPLDHFPINTLTTKVFFFMVKKGKNFSRNVTPLFRSMLAQPTKDEGAVSERPSETQPKPSPTHPSEDQSEPQPDPFLRPSSSNPIPDSIPEGSGGNQGAQAANIKDLKAQIK
ncbi:hypothetical protein Tco_0019946 [Tanacetum coccineum]